MHQVHDDNIEHTSNSKQVADNTHQLRKMRGGDGEGIPQGMNIEELHQLEKTLEFDLIRVLHAKVQRITNETKMLDKKGAEMMEEHQLLKPKLIPLLPVGETDLTPNQQEEGISSKSANISSPLLLDDDGLDTSLKLGLPF